MNPAFPKGRGVHNERNGGVKINLAKSTGFCFGVNRAIDIALKTTATGTNIYILGDIVHNEDVVRQIKEAGVRKIKRLTSGKGKTLLIRAHGTCLDTLWKAHRLGYKIVDATCPMVKEIHKIAQRIEQKGYRVIVIGDKKHDEVHGIIGQLQPDSGFTPLEKSTSPKLSFLTGFTTE